MGNAASRALPRADLRLRYYRLRIWAIVVVLVLSMLPTMEVVEAAVHLVEYGDLVHDQHDQGGQLGTDEHGCSGTFHLCGCHNANVMTAALSAAAISIPRADTCFFDLNSWTGRGAKAPPIRPPIA